MVSYVGSKEKGIKNMSQEAEPTEKSQSAVQQRLGGKRRNGMIGEWRRHGMKAKSWMR